MQTLNEFLDECENYVGYCTNHHSCCENLQQAARIIREMKLGLEFNAPARICLDRVDKILNNEKGE